MKTGLLLVLALLLVAAAAIVHGGSSVAREAIGGRLRSEAREAVVDAEPEAEAPALQIGAPVPGDITLTDIDGKEHALASYRGKIVFVHFWSIVCPYEKLAEPKCIDLQKTYAEKGVVQIAINANQGELASGGATHANLRAHVAQAGVNFMVTVDPGNKLTDQFGGKSTPHCFVIDKQGVLRYSGALDDDPRGTKGAQAKGYLRDAIDALLAGRDVPVATTEPYG
jgi:thiol-disulfide isomerase/thioredoxin